MIPLLLALLGGCDSHCGFFVTAWCLDWDGDGYPYFSKDGKPRDCNDELPEINPGADEICDSGIDNDCNGLADEDDVGNVQFLITCYCDGDGDGTGFAGEESEGCTACGNRPGTDRCEQWSEDPTDCNDADPSEVGQLTWYEDADGDGFGKDDVVEQSCVAPPGFVGEPGDCVDEPELRGAEEVHPAAPEICLDSLDNNCSGDEGDTWCGYDLGLQSLADGAVHMVGLDESDRFGHGVAIVQLPTDSGVSSPDAWLAVGGRLIDRLADEGEPSDPSDDIPALTNPGAVTLFSEALPPVPELTLFGENNSEYAGSTLAPGGDFDGDGLPDLVVGAYNGHDDAGATTGRAYVLLGTDHTDGGFLADGAVTILGPSVAAELGDSLDGGTDVNGDGFSDVILGAPLGDHETACTTNRGAAYVLLGGPDYAPGDTRATAATCSCSTDNSTAACACDLGCAADTGRLGLAGDLVPFFGTDTNEHAGQGVAFVGDMNGDGAPDMAIGANLYGDEQMGAVHLVWGWDSEGVDPGVPDTPADAPLDDRGRTLYGTGLKAGAGSLVSGVGDMDGDGYDDFAVAAPSAYNADGFFQAGVVYLVMGDQLRDLLETTPDDDGYPLDEFPRVEGSEPEEQLGTSLAGIGTGDDDYADLVAGAPNANGGLGAPRGNNGLLHLVRGHPGIGELTTIVPDDPSTPIAPTPPSATFYGAADTSGFGWTMTGLLGWGDDPFVVVGAAPESNGHTSDGSTYLLPWSWFVACDQEGETCRLPE